MTPWSLVARAGRDSDVTMREALGMLLQRYLPALRAHLILHRRLGPDLADDLLQSFVSRKVLEQRLIKRSDRSRGKFRSFLLKALDHFVIDELRSQRARGGGAAQLTELEELDLADDDADVRPSDAFDRVWARQVLDEAVRRMRIECEASHRPDIWGVFEQRVLAPALHGAQPAPYDRLIEQFDLRSPTQASNVLMTAKRMFARILRGVISESAQDEQELEEDLRDLRKVLGQVS